MSGAVQTSFATRGEKAREALSLAADVADYDYVILLVSGGRDSITAADVAARHGPSVGIHPDVVAHVNTGAGAQATQRVAQQIASKHGLAYIEGLNRREGERLGPRILKHGFNCRHTPEYRQRKERVFDKIYSGFPGRLLFVSGARHRESGRRRRTTGDSPINDSWRGGGKPRVTWVNAIHGFVDDDVRAHLDTFDLPESIAYEYVHHSAECNACAHDDPRDWWLLHEVDPYLVHGLLTLVQWTYMRIRRGDIDIPLERCIWGWEKLLNDAEPDRAGCDQCARLTLGEDGGSR